MNEPNNINIIIVIIGKPDTTIADKIDIEVHFLPLDSSSSVRNVFLCEQTQEFLTQTRSKSHSCGQFRSE